VGKAKRIGPHGLLPREVKFVHFFCERGNATQAAALAGYPNGPKGKNNAYQGHALLRRDRVLAAIREETQRRLDAGGALARNIIEELATSGPPSVRFQAAKELLDRSVPKILQTEHRHLHAHVALANLSDQELIARAQQLSQSLGIVQAPHALPSPVPAPIQREPETVDAEFVPMPERLEDIL
jgi:phage terminase small subunit